MSQKDLSQEIIDRYDNLTLAQAQARSLVAVLMGAICEGRVLDDLYGYLSVISEKQKDIDGCATALWEAIMEARP